MSLLINSLLLCFVAVPASILLIAIIYFKYSFGYWKRKNVPFLEPRIPFGNMSDFVLSKKNFGVAFADLYVKAKERSERFLGFYMFAKPYLLVTDPELIKSILGLYFQKFQDRGLYVNEKHDPLTGTIFHLSGSKWRKIRNKISPLFTLSRLKSVSTLFAVNCKQLEVELDKYSSKALPLDIKHLADNTIVDNVGRTVFGLECNSFKRETDMLKYSKLFVHVNFSDPLKTALSLFLPKVFDIFKIPFTFPEITNYFLTTFNETIETRKKSGIQRNDLIDIFVRLENNEVIEDDTNTKKEAKSEDVAIGRNELVAQAFLFLLAGWTTSSDTITFCMYEVSKNQDIQNKLRKEIVDVLKRYNGEMCYDAIMEMTYMDLVINETLRKYPAAPVLQRKCTEDVQLPGTNFVIERGTLVWISLLGLQRDPEYFANPDEFDPERFRENTYASVYLPFGDGPKFCIGMKFGLLQIKFKIATLLKGHKYTLHKEDLNTEFNSRGFPLVFKDRVVLNVEKCT